MTSASETKSQRQLAIVAARCGTASGIPDDAKAAPSLEIDIGRGVFDFEVSVTRGDGGFGAEARWKGIPATALKGGKFGIDGWGEAALSEPGSDRGILACRPELCACGGLDCEECADLARGNRMCMQVLIVCEGQARLVTVCAAGVVNCEAVPWELEFPAASSPVS
jgi:hypothetical protein